jgi:hypothetical protein
MSLFKELIAAAQATLGGGESHALEQLSPAAEGRDPALFLTPLEADLVP